MKKILNGCRYQEKVICGLKTYMIKNKIDDNFLISLYLPHGANISQYKIDGKRVKTGSAHFIEHRLFDSINGNVSELCANLGLMCNAETSSSYTLYYIFGPKKNFLCALKLLFDMFFYIKRDDKKLKVEKKIILSEARETCATYIDKFEKDATHRIFKGTFYENMVIGSAKDIKNTTYDDLILYHEAFYKKSSASLIVLGNFSFSIVERFIKNYKFNKEKAHDSLFIKESIIKRNRSQKIVKDVPSGVFYYSFNLDEIVFDKYNNKINHYLNFLDDILNSSLLMDSICKKYKLSKYIYLNYVDENFKHLAFQGYIEADMKDIILNKFLKEIKNSVSKDDLIAYFKGSNFDNIYNFDNHFALNENIVSILDNKGEVYQELKSIKEFEIEEFYAFIDDLINHSIKSYICLEKE